MRENHHPLTLTRPIDWRAEYPGLPTIEEARRQADPVCWLSTSTGAWLDEDGRLVEEPFCSYFIFGYSTDPFTVFGRPTDGSFSLMSIEQYLRDGLELRCYGLIGMRYFGLIVLHESKCLGWGELDDGGLDQAGPGTLNLFVEEGSRPRSCSEVLRDYPDYDILDFEAEGGATETEDESLVRFYFRRFDGEDAPPAPDLRELAGRRMPGPARP